MASTTQIHFGMGIALRLQNEWSVYLSSLGVADPRISLRAREGNHPLLRFDRCVFRILPAPPLGVSAALASRQEQGGPVVYGRSILLQHVHSGLFATVVRKPSEVNPAHFRVALMTSEDAGGACRFRLVSRYKIRSEGDVIHNNDIFYVQQELTQISLHATVTRSQQSGTGLDESQCENNASDVPSALEMVLYDDNRDLDPRHPVLSAGTAAMIFHREKDALLTVPSPLDNPSEQNRRRRRTTIISEMTRPQTGPTMMEVAKLAMSPGGQYVVPFYRHTASPVSTLSVESLPVTSNSLWFFENVDPTIGGPLGVGAPCRLRHGVTGKYLVALPASATAAPTSPKRGVQAAPAAEYGPLEYRVLLSPLDTPELGDASVLELELVASSVSSPHILSTKSFLVAKHHQSNMYFTTVRSSPTASLLTLTTPINLEATLAYAHELELAYASSYKRGVLSDVEYDAALADLGMLPDRRALVMRRDTILRTPKVSAPRPAVDREVTEAQLTRAYQGGLIDEAEYRSRLRARDYSGADVDLLVNLAAPKDTATA